MPNQNEFNEIEQMLLDLTTHYTGSLNDWEEGFVENMQEIVENYSVHVLTGPQVNKIKEIFNRIDGE